MILITNSYSISIRILVEVVKTNQCKLLTLSCSPWDRVQLLGINKGTVRTSFLHNSHKRQPLGIAQALFSVSILPKLCIDCSSIYRGLLVKENACV